MIPKKIHYVWVGEQPKPASVLKCIESWKKHMPDYEIKEWGNAEHEQIKNNYSDQAFKYKKWAFVSDYIRLYALYNEGGIYLDTDVEITKSLQQFMDNDFFSGYEIYKGKYMPILTALMGCKKNNPLVNELLSMYDNEAFVTSKGRLNLEPNTNKVTRFFEKKYGIAAPYEGNTKIVLEEKCIIYPSYYFCSPEENKENYAIHHYSGSWIDGYIRKNSIPITSKYKIIRFKKNKYNNLFNFSLNSHEKMIFQLKLGNKVILCLVRKIK